MLFKLKLLFMLVGTFLIRPAAFGQDYTIVGVVLFAGAFFLHIIESKRQSPTRDAVLNKQNHVVMVGVLLLYTYLLVHATLMNSINLMDAFKAALAHVVIIIAAAFILSDKRTNLTYFRSLTMILILLVASYCVTMILSIFIPLAQMRLFQLHYGNYETAGETYFPFTVLYGVFTVDKLHFLRLSGLFRESGILQMFLIWALFNLKSLKLNKWWAITMIIVGIAGTFSTAGVAILGINLVIYCFLKKRTIEASLLMAVAYFAIFYMPFIGINAKSDGIHKASVSDRTKAITDAWTSLNQHPFGVGLYNTLEHNSAINLIASSYMIGIFGFFLCLIVYFSPLAAVQNKGRFLLAITPILVTSLFSQPIFDAPLVYLLLMSIYTDEAEQSVLDTAAAINRQKPIKLLKPKAEYLYE